MATLKRKLNIYYAVAIVSLFLGLICYLLFREKTYVSEIINSIINLKSARNYFKFIENDFLKYYFPDFLWAVSFSCCLHIIFNPKICGSIICTIVIAFIGIVFETLQFLKIINGTGDVLDVCLYILGGFKVNMITLKRGKMK